MFQLSDSPLWAVAADCSQILHQAKTVLVFVESYKEGWVKKDEEFTFLDYLRGGLSLSLFLVIATFCDLLYQYCLLDINTMLTNLLPT